MTRGWRLVLVLLLSLAALASCSTGRGGAPTPAPTPTAVDYAALETAIEDEIATGSASLDNIRAVLVNVDGQTRISHYRHGTGPEDTTHVWSVTKSVVSTLVGMAIEDGLIGGLDDPLGELLPRHRRAMAPAVAEVRLRELMTMSAGFIPDPPDAAVQRLYVSGGDLVGYLLENSHAADLRGQFRYSNVSSHLVAAVLAAALQRADGDDARSVLDYAREELFDPLGIDTRPAFTEPVAPDSPALARAGFGWLSDPRGIAMGAFGLRLRPADLVKLGELYRADGIWQGRQVLPADWFEQVTTPSDAEPQYGLMWWLYTWNGHDVVAARGYEGHLIVVVPDHRLVVTVSSANGQELPIDDEALFPLVNQLIMPAVPA